MRMCPKTKQLLSLLLAFVMLLGMAIPAYAEDGTPAETSGGMLYVRKAGTESLVQSLVITAADAVEFFYGDPAAGVSQVSADDLTWDPLGYSDAGNGLYTIDGTVGETYTVIHTASGAAVTLIFTAEEQVPDTPTEAPMLRARVLGTMSLRDFLSADQTFRAIFYYGTAGNTGDGAKVAGPDALSHTGFAMEYLGTADGETDVWEISFPSGATSGTVTHLASGSTFSVTYVGGEGPGGEGPQGPVYPILLAKLEGQTSYTSILDVSGGPVEVAFYIRESADAEGTKLTSADGLTLNNVTLTPVEDKDGIWSVNVSGSGSGTISHPDSEIPVSVEGPKQGPDTEGGGADGKVLFVRFADSGAPTPSMTISAGLEAHLTFHYGVYGDSEAAAITDPAALSATGGVNLSYDAEAGHWNVSLQGGCDYGEISYTPAGETPVKFTISLADDGGSTEQERAFFSYDIAAQKNLTAAELTAGSTLDVVFRYGTADDYTEIPSDSSSLTIRGVATLIRAGQPEGSEFQNVCRIGVTGAGSGAIIWNGDFGCYEFPLTGNAAEGGEEEYTEGTLLAFWENMSQTSAPFELLPTSSSPLFFAIGSASDPTIITWDEYESGALRTEGVATLEKNTWAGMDNLFTLGVSDYGSGAVVYTKDNVKYRFEVAEAARLYARDGNNNILPSVTVEVGAPTDVCLCYGTSKRYEIVPAGKVSGSGVISVSPAETENMVTLTASGAGAGVITYRSSNGTQVLELLGVKKGIFATWDDGSGYMSSWDLALNTGSPLLFYLGVPGNATPITWADFDSGAFTASGEVTLSKNETSGTANVFHVGTTGTIGSGTLTYTKGGVSYTFSVKVVERYDDSGDPRLLAYLPDTGEITDTLWMNQKTMTAQFRFGTRENAQDLTHENTHSTGGGITLTPVEGDETGKLFTLEITDSGYVYFEVDGVTYGMPVYFNGGGGGSHPSSNGVKIDYKGKEITVFLGMLQEQTMNIVWSFGDWYNDTTSHDFNFQFILGALQDFETTSEAPAPQEFFDCITGVRFYIADWENEDGSTDTPNWKLTATESFNTGGAGTLSGINTWRSVLSAPNGHGFACVMAMDFTIELPGEEPQSYTLTCDGSYRQVPEMHIYANDPDNPATYLDTAEKLNAVLSSREALESWLEANFPDAFEVYSLSENLTLYLPAVTYDEVIVLNCSMTSGSGSSVPSVNIVGAGDYNGTETVMPGFLNKSGNGEIRYIHFKGNKNQKITYNSKSFTCGILIDGPANSRNDMIGVHGCIFEDLEYGIYDTPTGYHGITSACTFISCEYGLYIDCKNKPEGTGGSNDEHTGNTFKNCKFAVWVKSLPEYITPYMLRVVDNVFLNNHKDIKVTTPGRHYYYFYRNFYFGSYQAVSPFSTRQEGRAAEVEIADSSEAVVLTSPSYRYQGDQDSLWMFEDSTGILNDQASSLQIAQESLCDLTGQKEISVIGDASTGEAIAIWTFGTEGGSAE